ncbi:redoxin domain-containing protein [Candidatus Poribacteria bacterium]
MKCMKVCLLLLVTVFSIAGLVRKGSADLTVKISESGSGAAWSPDSKKLVYGHDGDGGVWIADLDSKEETQLVPEGKDPSWSPDGKMIAYVLEKEAAGAEIWLTQADGSGEPEHLVKGMLPHWTANGKEAIYFPPRTRALYAINIENKETRKVASVGYLYSVLSPDEKRVAYVARGGLWTVDVDNPTTMTNLSMMETALLMTWSPDAQHIAYGGYRGIDLGMWIVPTDGSQVLRRLLPGATRPAWSPDGKLIAYDDGIEANPGIAVVNVDEALPQALTLQEVASEIEKELESKEVNPSDCAKLGSFMVWAEEYEGAIKAFTRGSELDPQEEYFKQRLIQCYEKLGKKEQAKELRIQLDPSQALVDALAPDFTLSDLGGQEVSLSNSRGKVIIVDFWATWCGPCVKEIPHFIELNDEYGEQDFAMIGISMDRNGTEVVESFVEKHQIDYPILMSDGKVEIAYGGIQSIPTTFVVDKAGKIQRRYVGYRDKAVFEADIKVLLAEE